MFYLLSGILLWYLIIFVYKTKTGSPSVMSEKAHIKKLVKYVKPGMWVADMGAGDGGALIEMVRAGAARGEGWEIEPLIWLRAKRKIRQAGMGGQIQVRYGDMWRANLSRYELVYVYQLTRYAPRFVKKCRREMKKGSIVAANTYPLAGLPLWRQDGELFLYRL